ncbi:MAG: hypothetical protein R3249_06925 [Nitriliruptorales bacterium]|nr:hypothetical protein [Nitriliruptorales bacterium]
MAGRLRLRRVVTRAAAFLLSGLLAAAVVIPAVAQSGPQPGVQDADRPFSWTGRAGAFGIGIQFNTDPTLVPIEELIRGELPQADSEWQGAGIIRGRAAALYPGSSGTGGPGLLCDFGFPCSQISDGLGGTPFPPPYPLVAEAQYPSRPEVTSQDGLSRAVVGPDGIETVASVTDNENAGGFLDILDPVISIGSAEARTTQEFVGPELVVTARSLVTDIALPGGLLHIGSVEARSVSRADAETADTDASLTIQGASLAGIPVSISDRGLTVDETVLGPVGAASFDSALQVLQDTLNLEIRAIGPQFENTGLGSSGHVTGLLIRMDVPISDPGVIELPSIPFPPEAPFPGDPNAFLVTYKASLVLAAASTTAHANDADFGGGIIPPPPIAPPAPAPQPPVVAPPVPGVGSPPAAVPDPAVPDPVVGPQQPDAPPPAEVDEAALARFLESLGIEFEWAHLYPLVVLWALFLFVPVRVLRFLERHTRPTPVRPAP